MSCCSIAPLDGGLPPGAGAGGDASAWAADYDTVGAVVVSTPLVDLPIAGAWTMLRGLQVSSIVIAGFGVAQFGVTWDLPAFTAQANAIEVFAYGSPNAAPIGNAGYQAPGLLGAAGYGAVAYAIVGTQVHLQTTGLAGFTVRFGGRGNLYVFDGAVRLI